MESRYEFENSTRKDVNDTLADKSFVAHYAIHVQPYHILDLLRTSLDLPRLQFSAATTMPCGPIAQAWQRHIITQNVIRYLLLLDDPPPAVSSCSLCPRYSAPDDTVVTLDTAHFHSARNLILELLLPKIGELLQSWKDNSVDRSSQVSTDTFRSAVYACISGLLMTSHFANVSSRQVDIFEADLQNLTREILKFVSDAEGSQALVETLLQCVQSYLPSCESSELARLSQKSPRLQEFFNMIAGELGRRRLVLESFSRTVDHDLMDLDDEFLNKEPMPELKAKEAMYRGRISHLI
jgi:ataxia telangiectasia mutated family protein